MSCGVNVCVGVRVGVESWLVGSDVGGVATGVAGAGVLVGAVDWLEACSSSLSIANAI
jgi:hypothetical protein